MRPLTLILLTLAALFMNVNLLTAADEQQADVGRYVLKQLGSVAVNTFMIDTKLGLVWQIVEDKETKNLSLSPISYHSTNGDQLLPADSLLKKGEEVRLLMERNPEARDAIWETFLSMNGVATPQKQPTNNGKPAVPSRLFDDLDPALHPIKKPSP